MRYLAAVLLLAVCCVAGDKYAPLPGQLLSAKKVCLVNVSGRPRVLDDAYKAITKWNRYELVDKQSDADLIFVISADSTGDVQNEMQFGQDQIVTRPGFGEMTSTIHRAPRLTMHDQTGETTLRVFDAHADDLEHSQAIWRITVPWSASGSGKVVIEEIKKRIKEQEKRA